MNDISLFEVIHSQRAVRNFSTEPVSDEAMAIIMDAAIRAPSGGNRRRPLHEVVFHEKWGKTRMAQQ